MIEHMLLVGIVLVSLVLIVCAAMDGFLLAKEDADTRLVSEEGVELYRRDPYRFEVDLGWEVQQGHIYAAIGCYLVTGFWLIAWWQADWQWERLNLPVLLAFSLVPPLIWLTHNLSRYSWLSYDSVAGKIAGALVFSCIGPIAWPFVAAIWVPGYYLCHLYERWRDARRI